jgi:predicted RND superfamily exporter protein
MPAKTNATIAQLSSFDIGAWNYFVLDLSSENKSFCLFLKNELKAYFSKIMCQPKINEHMEIAEDWLKDQFYFGKSPTLKQFKDNLALETSKITILMGSAGQDILKLSRLDPMNSKEFLWKKINNISNGGFQWSKGFLTFFKDKKIIIPVQFSYKANLIDKTISLLNHTSHLDTVLIGRHQDFYSNKNQVEEDLKLVTILSILLYSFLIFALIKYKSLKALVFFVPVAISSFFSGALIILIYGSIHGLTLSFGIGIIGLGLDYGLHSCFGEDDNKIWKSNFLGLVTTLVVFIIFSFSNVPLIRQMMIFSSIGLVISFITTYFFLRKTKIKIERKDSVKVSAIHKKVFFIIISGLLCLTFLKLNLSPERFNFSNKKVKKAQEWFYKNKEKNSMFFKVYDYKDIEQAHKDIKSISDDINNESVFSYIKTVGEQKKNLHSWELLKNNTKDLSQTEIKLFKPFLENLKKSIKNKEYINLEQPKKYLSHLTNDSGFISLWFTANKSEENQIKENVKGVVSLKDTIVNFSQTLKNEIFIFTPITLVVIFLILYFSYRKLSKSLICLIPFFFSLSLYILSSFIFNLNISFMSLIGVFLVYGLSVDYGIFSIDGIYSNKNKSNLKMALHLSWVTSIAGFLPLALCEHNILKDLGIAISIGLIGIYYSTFYIIPSFCLNKGKI